MHIRGWLVALVLALLVTPGATASTVYTVHTIASNPAIGIGCGGIIPCVAGYNGVSGARLELPNHDGAYFVLDAEGIGGTPAQVGVCFYPTTDATGTSLACYNNRIWLPHFEDAAGHIPAGARSAYFYVSYGVDVTVTLEVF